jgi:hypothetical protein
METEEIKKKIQLAISLVQDVPEPFKAKAFEVILSNLLEGVLPKKASRILHEETKVTEVTQNVELKTQKLAELVGIEISQLKDIFQFEEKGPTFIGRVNGTEAEKQVQVCRLAIFILKEVYGQEWIEGSFLWKILQDCRIGSLDNLAANLRARENEFRMMGQKKGKKYKLTELGRQNAIQSLRQLATQ